VIPKFSGFIMSRPLDKSCWQRASAAEATDASALAVAFDPALPDEVDVFASQPALTVADSATAQTTPNSRTRGAAANRERSE
jgi:hypothetical protein